MKKSTLWYRVGKSNWYTRVDARGLEVKRQGRLNDFARNNSIIRGVRKHYKERKPLAKLFDERVFNIERPTRKKTIIIYQKKKGKMVVLEKRDVLPQDFYKVSKWLFNFHYPGIVRGEIYYTIDNL